MDNRALTFMTIAVVVCIAILMMINLVTLTRTAPATNLFDEGKIAKFTVVHSNQEYTFSRDQQNNLITLLKQAVPIDATEAAKGVPTDFEKLTIYREDGSKIEIIPVAYLKNELIFSAPWNPNGLLRDTSHGTLKALLSLPFNRKEAEELPQGHKLEVRST